MSDQIIRDKCFIITPIGDNMSEIRRRTDGLIDSIIIPLLNESSIDMECIVAHRKFITGDITTGIIKDIFDAKLVIADLTTLNPNVMYEVAIRDCIKKPIVLISEKGTKIPFDISNMNTIIYTNDFMGVVELKGKLKSFIENIDFINYEADNLITKANLTINLYSEVERLPESSMKEVLNSVVSKLEKIENQLSHNKTNDDQLNIAIQGIRQNDYWLKPMKLSTTIDNSIYEQARIISDKTMNNYLSSINSKNEDKI